MNSPVEHRTFTVPATQGVLLPTSKGGGYETHQAEIHLCSAPAAIYLDLHSGTQESIHLSLDVDKATSLIVTLQQALEDHQAGRRWLIDTFDDFLMHLPVDEREENEAKLRDMLADEKQPA